MFSVGNAIPVRVGGPPSSLDQLTSGAESSQAGDPWVASNIDISCELLLFPGLAPTRCCAGHFLVVLGANESVPRSDRGL